MVGGAVLRHLIAAGRPVRALARSSVAEGTVSALGATPVAGDVLDVMSLYDVFAGAEVVYHVAGVNAFCMRDPSPMYAVNVDGTRNVLRAAREAGVRRVVYTSSAIVLGEAAGTVGSETSPHRGSFLSHYERSKFEAEQVAFAEAGRLELVVVNPSSVQGPGRVSGTGRLILDVINGRFPVMVDSTLSIVDIDDCARGHLLAEQRGVPGRRYVLNGFSLTVRRALDLLARAAGVDVSVRFLPHWSVRALVPVVDLMNRFRSLPVCGEMLRVMLHGHTYDGSRAVRELGLTYTPASDTLRRTVEWFREQGLLQH